MPELTLDAAATALEYDKRSELFSDILPVKKVGMKHYWFTPWDNLIRFWGVEQAMMDLVLRPEMVNAAVSRWVDASLRLIDQWEALNLLALNNDNTRIGSGGYGYTQDLPGADLIPGRVRSPQHVGLRQRTNLLRGLAGNALGIRASTRDALFGAMGADLLRLLRTAGPQNAHPSEDS